MSYTALKSMLTLGAVSALGLAVHTSAGAQEVGRVLSSTAIISQVTVPRQICAQEVVQVPGRTGGGSGAGAIMGGIAGGAMGNAVGQGAGRAAATVIGVLGGAILGDRIEGGGQQAATTQTVNRCTTQNVLENRTSGYQVVYEYAGKQYSVQMPNDPGPTIALQVAPVGAVQQAVPPVAQQAPVVGSGVIVQPAPTVVYTQQPTVVYAPPVVVAAPYYYPNPVFGASFVFRGGHGHGHGHGGHRAQQRPHRYY
ncbi:MAG: hypothetical protein WB821_02675 [Burkholderiaceae bacterium]